jgi:DNA replication protein DnaC
VHSVAQSWKGDPWLLAIIGTRGTGKTYLAVSVLARLAAEHPPEYRNSWKGLWVDCVEALDSIRAEIGTDRDGKTINALMRANVLVLDDVGSDRITRDSSAFRSERLALVLRHRYNHLLPTIITANVQHLDDIAPGDERLQRRIADCEKIHLEGEILQPKRRSP